MVFFVNAPATKIRIVKKFPKISEDSKKYIKNFPSVFEGFRTLPKRIKKFQYASNTFPIISEYFKLTNREDSANLSWNAHVLLSS